MSALARTFFTLCSLTTLFFALGCGDDEEPEPNCGYNALGPELEDGATDIRYFANISNGKVGGTVNFNRTTQVSGLPAGLSFNGLTIEGIPEEAGSFNLVFTDDLPEACSQDVITQNLTLMIEQSPIECESNKDCDLRYSGFGIEPGVVYFCAQDSDCPVTDASCLKGAPRNVCLQLSGSLTQCGDGTREAIFEKVDGSSGRKCVQDITVYQCNERGRCI